MQPRGDGRIFPLIDEQLHFLFHRFNEASEAGVFARLLAESRSTTSDGVKLRDFTDSRKLLVKADKLIDRKLVTDCFNNRLFQLFFKLLLLFFLFCSFHLFCLFCLVLFCWTQQCSHIFLHFTDVTINQLIIKSNGEFQPCLIVRWLSGLKLWFWSSCVGGSVYMHTVLQSSLLFWMR